MITGSMSDYETEYYLPAYLKEIISKTKTIITNKPEQGRYDIYGDNAFVLIQEPITESYDLRLAELHHQYIDIQILLIGEETIGYGLSKMHQPADDDQLDNKDIAFYRSIPNEQFVTLQPEQFVIFHPYELHRPLCALNGIPKKIKKAVIKIKL